MEKATRILVVDDDLRMRALLEEFLAGHGFSVKTLADGRDVSRALAARSVDIMVLDLMLPGEDGLSICKRLRSDGVTVPIIMLTAKGADVDRIVGLEIGADDYLPKPFNPRELLARIGAVLRRTPDSHTAESTTEHTVYAFGPFELHTLARRLTRSGEAITLTSGEFAVLRTLVSHPHQPLSREQLLKLSRGREFAAFDRSMDVQVSRLRRLIEEDVSHPRYIQTVWGFGYVFVPEGNAP
jgi:two-component system, OmpR family, phosphate regulon response regulator OmpR